MWNEYENIAVKQFASHATSIMLAANSKSAPFMSFWSLVPEGFIKFVFRRLGGLKQTGTCEFQSLLVQSLHNSGHFPPLPRQETFQFTSHITLLLQFVPHYLLPVHILIQICLCSRLIVLKNTMIINVKKYGYNLWHLCLWKCECKSCLPPLIVASLLNASCFKFIFSKPCRNDAHLQFRGLCDL